MAIKKSEVTTLSIDPLKRGRVTLKIMGRTPLFFNSMSAKAQRTLLLGGGKKTAAERKELKHDPYKEFRASVYTTTDKRTRLGFPAAGVKGAMATAALETAGVTKTSVQRLIFLPQERICIWGVPQLRMDVVRSADMNKTPDVRTRAFLPEWCAEIEIAYVEPTLNETFIVSLLANAGAVVGIGDFRQEKGRGSFGTFDVVKSDNPDWTRVAKAGGYMQQMKALENPTYANEDTETLMAEYDHELAVRNATAA